MSALCRNGLHELEPEDSWRAPNGARCPFCWNVTQRRYDKSARGLRRKIEYDQRDGHDTYLQEDALAERERYEASGSTLPMYEWLNIHEPLGKLMMPSCR